MAQGLLMMIYLFQFNWPGCGLRWRMTQRAQRPWPQWQMSYLWMSWRSQGMTLRHPHRSPPQMPWRKGTPPWLTHHCCSWIANMSTWTVLIRPQGMTVGRETSAQLPKNKTPHPVLSQANVSCRRQDSQMLVIHQRKESSSLTCCPCQVTGMSITALTVTGATTSLCPCGVRNICRCTGLFRSSTKKWLTIWKWRDAHKNPTASLTHMCSRNPHPAEPSVTGKPGGGAKLPKSEWEWRWKMRRWRVAAHPFHSHRMRDSQRQRWIRKGRQQSLQ